MPPALRSSMRFTSFDGETMRVSSDGDKAQTRVCNGKGPEKVARR